MAKLRRKKIAQRTVEGLKVDEDTVFWDSQPSDTAGRWKPAVDSALAEIPETVGLTLEQLHATHS